MRSRSVAFAVLVAVSAVAGACSSDDGDARPLTESELEELSATNDSRVEEVVERTGVGDGEGSEEPAPPPVDEAAIVDAVVTTTEAIAGPPDGEGNAAAFGEPGCAILSDDALALVRTVVALPDGAEATTDANLRRAEDTWNVVCVLRDGGTEAAVAARVGTAGFVPLDAYLNRGRDELLVDADLDADAAPLDPSRVVITPLAEGLVVAYVTDELHVSIGVSGPVAPEPAALVEALPAVVAELAG